MHRCMCFCLVFTLATAETAVSQPASGYAELVRQGKEAFKAKDFARAADLFQQAYAAENRGNLLYNIGLCYEKAGDIGSAIEAFERFVQAVPNSKRRPAVERKIARLKSRPSDDNIAVTVRTSPSGALIFVDDKSRGAMGAAPLRFTLPPGRYKLIVELSGHETVTRDLELVKGSPAEVDLELVSSQTVGQLKLLVSERDAVVLVDGKRIGRSPLKETLRLPAGAHEISVLKPGFATWKRSVNLPPGELVTHKVRLSGGEEDFGSPSEGYDGQLWSYVTMGVGAAVIAGGVATGMSARGLHDQLSDKQSNGEAIADSDIDRGNSLVMMTNLLLGVGSAAVIGGGVWWWLGRDATVETRGDIVTTHLGVTPTGEATFLLRGTF